ncbi:MAG TPA: tetratricopeptide repeat protein [Candidatus Krumholzibacteria bacterium]
MKKQALLTTAIMVAATAAFAGLHTRSGTVYVQNKQYNEAVRELRLAIQEDAKDSKAHFMIGVAYSFLDSVGLAYDHFTKAKELDPKKAQDCDDNIQSNYAKHYQQGQKFFQQQNMAGAAHEFEMATQASPKQSSAHYNLAVAYSRLANPTDSTYYAKTLAAADKVLELTEPKDPNYLRALQLAANQLVYLGKPEEAKARLQKTIDEDPSQYPIVEEMGMDLFAKQKWAGAASFLKLAAEGRTAAGAEDSTIYYNIASCEYNQRKDAPEHIDEAITYYEKALIIAPNYQDAVFALMGAYAVKEDWANASVWGEKYVSLNPTKADTWRVLARCYSELGEDDKATEALNRYTTLKGSN